MKRLSGGQVLLNLTAISLVLTSGEVSITDAGILGELTELRNFIDVNRDFSKGFKNLKPVLIEYRSSASKFNGIALANLSFNTDALHMSIGANTIQDDGKMLVITINVVYEWVDYIGYQVSSAKLNAYETLATGDGTFTGDVGVGGDLEVTGDVTIGGDIIGDIEVDGEIVEKMTGYSASLGTSDETLTINNIYSSVVKNGNKLTFVSYLKIKRLDTLSPNYRNLIAFTIPSDVFAKLYPISESGSLALVLCVNRANYFKDLVIANMKEIATTIYKTSTAIVFTAEDLSVLDANEDYYVRIEQTFTLSENLIS